jgi:hypothetical protein
MVGERVVVGLMPAPFGHIHGKDLLQLFLLLQSPTLLAAIKSIGMIVPFSAPGHGGWEGVDDKISIS